MILIILSFLRKEVDMSIVEVLTYPNPILRQKSQPVKNFDANLKQLIRDMYDTMDSKNGIGLAAPQIGVLEQVVVVSYEGEDIELINPVIEEIFGKPIVMEEGCLSLPEVHVDVERKEGIRLSAQSVTGKTIQFQYEGMIARIIQHEIDHLNGVLITDKGIAK